MITVHIWKYRGSLKAWGHASLHVGQTYISWWPGESVAMLEALTLRTPLHRDLFDERSQTTRPGCPMKTSRSTAWTRTPSGCGGQALDWSMTAVSRWPCSSWHALKRNCSTVVAIALKVGGGDRYASWYRSWNLVWDPEDVRAYAHEIRDGLARVQAATRSQSISALTGADWRNRLGRDDEGPLATCIDLRRHRGLEGNVGSEMPSRWDASARKSASSRPGG